MGGAIFDGIIILLLVLWVNSSIEKFSVVWWLAMVAIAWLTIYCIAKSYRRAAAQDSTEQ